ncbi:MAG: cytochrome b N-terminal domain-containing protein [Actinobacteria bacterium]|nr:cytochrome b N-terminal domain-containing protein [Actinomycetota bacterium]
MPKTKSKRQQQIEAVALYPVDWLEERSGLIGGLRYFLFRKVPAETNWFHTLGSATLTAFIVQAVTGVILAMYYKPSAELNPETGKPIAYESIETITNDLTLGWLVRGMHRWGASVFIILLFLHMGRVFLFGAYKYPRELNWLVGAVLLLMAMGEGLTGYLLPWDQTSYWATVVAININANAPIAGPFLGDFLRGGQEIGSETLTRFYSLHMLVIPGGLAGLIALHLYLVVRLGITPPPWTKAAGGYEAQPNGGRPARTGLVNPSPRGNGNGGRERRES